MLSTTDMLLRIGLGAVLGGAIGYEREKSGRNLGFRTHLIAALAAATFTVVSFQFMYYQPYGDGEPLRIDPSRIASSVVAGIGFLAGGAILRIGATLRGLTTAAGMWLVTAIGMCAGAGMSLVALGVTGIGLFALFALRHLEGGPTQRSRLHLQFENAADDKDDVRRALLPLIAQVREVGYERLASGDSSLVLEVIHHQGTGISELVEAVEALPRVRCVKVATPDLAPDSND